MKFCMPSINPNRAGLLDVFDFLKVHNELRKVTKFGTSRSPFSWRNNRLKNCGHKKPSSTLGLNIQINLFVLHTHFIFLFCQNCKLIYLKKDRTDVSTINVLVTFLPDNTITYNLAHIVDYFFIIYESQS